ncbi:MAG TPA: YciI family protein [Thermoanaerobaculia bacterium]|nr:YciI family protein [Thermoanaerobaculia bacterium]
MLYAILCYDSEAEVGAMTQQEDDELMARLKAVNQTLMAKGKLGPTLRLMPTTAAATIRGGGEVIDGPFAETKEQLLGFWIVDCATREEAVEAARQLGCAKATGSLEVRPVGWSDFGSRTAT